MYLSVYLWGKGNVGSLRERIPIARAPRISTSNDWGSELFLRECGAPSGTLANCAMFWRPFFPVTYSSFSIFPATVGAA